MASIDVVVPCYQYGRFLRECVTSVLTQDVEDVRVLIIDNASTDDSVEVARQLAREDARVEVIVHERNLGPHASFNEGVDRATADYFMVLCADDLLVPGSLGRAMSIMEQHPEVSFAYGTDIYWDETTEPRPTAGHVDCAAWSIRSGSEFIKERCGNLERTIAQGMVLVRTSAQKAAGHYRPELRHADDFEMLLRLACFGSIAFTPAVQGITRAHGANRTQEVVADREGALLELLSALESFFKHEGRALANADQLRRIGRRRLSERAYWCGVRDLLRGRKSAAALLRLAVRLDPKVALIPPLNYLLRTKPVHADSPPAVA